MNDFREKIDEQENTIQGLLEVIQHRDQIEMNCNATHDRIVREKEQTILDLESKLLKLEDHLKNTIGDLTRTQQDSVLAADQIKQKDIEVEATKQLNLNLEEHLEEYEIKCERLSGQVKSLQTHNESLMLDNHSKTVA